MKILFITTFLILSFQSLQATSVRMSDEDNPVITLRDKDGDTVTLFTEKGGGNSGSVGTTEANAFKSYIPIDGPSNQANFHYLDSINVGNYLSTTSGVSFSIDVDNGGDGSLDVMVAIKVDSDGNYENIANLSTSGFLSYEALCDANIDDYSCSDFNSSSDHTEEATIFLYLADDDNDGIGRDLNPSSDELDGIFINLSISNDIEDYENSSTRVVSVTSQSGDKLIYLYYSGTLVKESVIRSMAIYQSDDSFFRILDLQDKEAGELAVNKLTNGQSYAFKLAYVDNYGFRTDRSAATAATAPSQVEKLLSKTQCYLITAGFGREHTVLNYFRYIRDEYLLKSSLGSRFVDFYYLTAPHYVRYILDNPWLAKTIRALSYTLYFILNNFIACLLGLLAIIGYSTWHAKRTT